MSNGFELKFAFVEKWGRIAKPEYLQIYIYILSCYKKNGNILSVEEISKKLHVSRDSVFAALDFWITAEVLEEDEEYGYKFIFDDFSKENKKPVSSKANKAGRFRVRPSYDSAEIDAVASVNKNVDYLFKQAEKILDRLLSPSDFEMIYSFVDWLGLPVEVVIMLLNFVAGQGKTTKRYIETVAIDWADKGIDTFESAENYIREIELRLSNEGKIRGLLGIYDRSLTQTEKKYIKLWTAEKNVPLELISEAYDRTVNATGKLSWAYMNKVLMSWCDEGIESISSLKEQETLNKLKSGAVKERSDKAKSKFVNYVDTNKTDYSSFAEEILKDMLDEN